MLLKNGRQILTTDLTGTTASNTSNATQESCDWAKMSVRPYFLFFCSIIFLVSLVLNTITVRVYFCSSHRFQSSISIYLKNLAAADLFVCLFLPLRIAYYASNSTTVRHLYCSLGAPGFYLNMYTSLLFMTYIAANRYLKIVHPLETLSWQKTCTARNITIMTWVLFSGIHLIYAAIFLFSSLDPGPPLHETGCKTLNSKETNVLYQIMHTVCALIFISVLVSLVLLYLGILRKLRSTQASLQARGSHAKLIRSRRNMLVLMVVFCVCFVPYHVVRLLYIFFKHLLNDCTKAQAFYIVKEITVFLSILNACMDPLIYFFFCKTFKAQILSDMRKISGEKIRTSKTLDNTENRVTFEIVA